MATNNSTIIGKFWLQGTNDMQQRIPNPSQAGVDQTIRELFKPMNGMYLNQFMDFMVNRIGLAYTRQQEFKNPLREFVKQKLYYGSTVTETQLAWIKGHSYNIDAEDVFKTYYPDGLQAFHSVNFENQYPITISREMMRMAVANETGLNELIAAVMQQPMNADEYDTMNAMLDLFTKMDEYYGFYRQHLDAAPTDEASARAMLKAMQELSYNLTIPTTIYSQVDLPVVVRPDELVMFVRADAMASVNVDGLAPLFHMEKADVPYRVITIPTPAWPLGDNDYSILTTSDFFQVYPVDYVMSSQYNPKTLANNTWLTDRKIISASPFVPTIVFSSDEGTTVPVVKMAPTSINLALSSETVEPGGTIQITPTLNGTLTPTTAHDDGVEIAPDAVTYTLTCAKSSSATDAVPLNIRTRVDKYNKLHVQKSGLDNGNVITITALSTYINPSGETQALTTSKKVTIKTS